MANTKPTLQPDKWIDNYADYLYNYAVVRINDSDLAKDLGKQTVFLGGNGGNAGGTLCKRCGPRTTQGRGNRWWCRRRNSRALHRQGQHGRN